MEAYSTHFVDTLISKAVPKSAPPEREGSKFLFSKNWGKNFEIFNITYFIELVVKNGLFDVVVSQLVVAKKVDIFSIYPILGQKQWRNEAEGILYVRLPISFGIFNRDF